MNDRGTAIAGILFIGLGIVFLLDRLDVWTVRTRFIWPIVLIALGVAIIARSSQRAR